MSQPKDLSLFITKLGWFALAGSNERVSWCSFGHPTRAAALRRARESLGGDLAVRDWNPVARRRLLDYAAGRPVTFDDIALDFSGVSAFHRAVLAACRAIPYAETISYAELAAAAGRPRAVRAAGSAMARNPLPILIPCHRVLRTGGGLGGYSAPQGVSLKKRLLEMEDGNRSTQQDAVVPRAPRRLAAAAISKRRIVRLA